MGFQSLILSLTFLALGNSAPLNKSQECTRDTAYPMSTPACPDYCAGTAFNASLADWYICGDSRLGPVLLPTLFPLSGLFGTYDRFGGLCPGDFLTKWFNPNTSYYNYPPDNGFQLNTAGQPIMGEVTLPVGLLIDRFGSETGTFVSPEGAPYMQRALPPSNLDTPKDDQRYVFLMMEWRCADDLSEDFRITTMFIMFRGLSTLFRDPLRNGLGSPGKAYSMNCIARLWICWREVILRL
jgi:hypothetical protein